MFVRTLILLLILTSILSGQTQTQTQSQPQPAAPPPGTEIYLIDLTNNAGNYSASDPKNITQRPGYDNQPGFTPDGNYILYTSFRGIQTDIYRYSISDGKNEQLIDTTESEFSPTIMPDQANISVVRVEPGQIQRLWKFPIKGGKPSLLLEKIQPVGYHAWIDGSTIALFVLGTPNTLQIADLNTGAAHEVTKSIGRSLHKIPGEKKISFTQEDAGEWFIKQLDVASGKYSVIARALRTQDHDYTWLPDRTLLMAEDAKLYKLKPGTDKDWILVSDFSAKGIKGITRIGASPDGKRIAIVAAE